MKSKNLKRKQKTQPGGSLEPVGSALGELVVLEYQLRKWGTECAVVKSNGLEGGSPSGLAEELPEFRTKELDGKV